MMFLFKAALSSIVILLTSACMGISENNVNMISNDRDYGVFLSLAGQDAIDASEDYGTVVIDAQSMTSEEIEEMQDRGQQVYSYLNLGSLETFRSYYDEYQYLTLKPYVNWENEFWIDASAEEWQEFHSVTLASQYLEKGIDGFWIDNVDVYYQFPTEEMYLGVENMLTTLMEYGKPVIINGGDQFVKEYLERNEHMDDILTGVNQETVFSSINFEDRTLGTQREITQEYYIDYLELVEQEGKDIFLLEYTTDSDLVERIYDYSEEKGWTYYISDSIELDGDQN